MAGENAAWLAVAINKRIHHGRRSQFQGPLATCRRRNRRMIATRVNNFTSSCSGVPIMLPQILQQQLRQNPLT
jgi:hypothetical protein